MKIRKYAFLTAFFSLLFLACGQHDIVEKETTYYEFSSSSNQQAGSSSSLSSSSNQMQETSSSSVDSSVDDCDFIINLRIDTECFYDETVKIPINRIPKSPIVLGSQARLKFADKASLQIMGYSLKIEPGAELSFGEDSELLVDAEGSLEISGEKESMVMLKADDYTKPWAGIRVRSDARSASIEYADLSGAKTGINFGKDGVLKNSKVHNNFEYGMRQNTPFLLGNFSNNEFYSNGRDALISLELAATLGAPEQFSGRLHISGGGDVPANAVLPGFAYDVEGAITVMGKLKIMPG
ncbi:MAG: hypothetical protein FWH22_01865, partial [Fibromonadales bacterium]|nr:hypothetical protein [Fibromonadales bacterium]